MSPSSSTPACHSSSAACIESLASSWISPEIAREAGVFRVTHQQAIELGISRTGYGDLSGIVFPYYDLEAKNVRGYRLRRDNPELERKDDGSHKPRAKYLSPTGQRNLLYVPPGLPGDWTKNAALPIVFVEGEKKCLAVHRLSLHAINDSKAAQFISLGISGAWSWKGRIGKRINPDGKRVDEFGPIPDLDRIDWKDRPVTLWPDANFRTNQLVSAGWIGLAEQLKRRGGNVHCASCPEQPGVNGPDDALAKLGPEWGLKELNRARETRTVTERIPRTEDPVQALRAYDCAEFLQLQLHDEEDYVVQTLVPKGGAILLYAIPKSLKTWFVTKLALDVTCGRPVLGKWAVPRPAH